MISRNTAIRNRWRPFIIGITLIFVTDGNVGLTTHRSAERPSCMTQTASAEREVGDEQSDVLGGAILSAF